MIFLSETLTRRCIEPLQIAITQSISGTGALRIGGAILNRFYPHSKTIYLPSPTWGNHIPIFKDSGLEVKHYRYYDKKTVGLDATGMLEDIKVYPCLSDSDDRDLIGTLCTNRARPVDLIPIAL